jgi:hypothetical protein
MLFTTVVLASVQEEYGIAESRTFLFLPYSPECVEEEFLEVGVGHPRGGSCPLLDKRCSHPRLIYYNG